MYQNLLANGIKPRQLVLYCITRVRLVADPETNEVFAKTCLIPVAPYGEVDLRDPYELDANAREKLSSFAKMHQHATCCG
jgi:hypothetical protein